MKYDLYLLNIHSVAVDRISNVQVSAKSTKARSLLKLNVQVRIYYIITNHNIAHIFGEILRCISKLYAKSTSLQIQCQHIHIFVVINDKTNIENVALLKIYQILQNAMNCIIFCSCYY